jgi:deoxyribodipyrimidine photo-lyase
MPKPPRPSPAAGLTGDLFEASMDGAPDSAPDSDPGFEPTPAAAHARLASVRPAAYARTRNHLHGAVTRLSPYLTHGLLSLREVVTHLRQNHGLGLEHKLVQELGWRAWWHHAWQHQGDAIFESLHPGPLPEAAYARELPTDVREACTGVPVIDQAVRTLHAQAWLHNHARMWLASYLVHIRHVHWRVGADWMHAHLLDGDLASNHLSWQWVAGTGSHKPYLFNAENVARYAPEDWHSFGSVVDTSYETLDACARGVHRADGRLGEHGGPTAHRRSRPGSEDPGRAQASLEPLLLHARPGAPCPAPDPAAFAGREVWLLHPWALDGPPSGLPEGTLVAGLWPQDHHRRWPWSRARWDFVGRRMDAITHAQWCGSAEQWIAALAGAARVRGWNDPHLGALGPALGLRPRPPAFAEPAAACRSFSQFWRAVRFAD